MTNDATPLPCPFCTVEILPEGDGARGKGMTLTTPGHAPATDGGRDE